MNTPNTFNENLTGSVQSYRHVQTGFQLFFYGILHYILFLIVFSAVAVLLTFVGIDFQDWGVSWLAYVGGTIPAICLIAAYVGTFYWLAAPQKTERLLMRVFHAILLIGLIGVIGCMLLHDYWPSILQAHPIIPLAIGQMLYIAQFWIFLKYCEKVAKNANCKSFLTRSQNCLFYLPVVIGFYVIGGAIAILDPSGRYLPIITICGGAFSLFFSISILLMLKDAIKELPRGSEIQFQKLGEGVAFIGLLIGTILEFALATWHLV